MIARQASLETTVRHLETTMGHLVAQNEYWFARLIAVETLLLQTVVPLLVAFDPKLASELVNNIRNDRPPRMAYERLQLLFDEYLDQMIDKVEGRIRSKLPSRR